MIDDKHDIGNLSKCISNAAMNMDVLPELYNVCKACATIGTFAKALVHLYESKEREEAFVDYSAEFFAQVFKLADRYHEDMRQEKELMH